MLVGVPTQLKRVVVIVLLLVVGLSVGLTYRLRMLDAYRSAPVGGSGSIEGTEVRITARIPARIARIAVKEGDRVRAGQLLVELECDEPNAVLAQARAQLAQAQANASAALAQVRVAAGSATVAQRSVLAVAAESLAAAATEAESTKQAERVRSLHERGAISSAQLDQVETAQTTAAQRAAAVKANQAAAAARVDVAWQGKAAAAAQADAAREAIEAARAAVTRAETQVEECRLVAPLDAIVETRAYEPGEVVLPGANVLTLVDLTEVEATFYLPNAELAAAAPGKAVTVVADAYPGVRFKGVMSHVATKAEFTPKNVQTREDRDRLVYAVLVKLPNPGGQLRSGMPVEVQIDGTAKNGAAK